MGLDFGGLAALSGVQPWQEIREERNRDSQRIAVLNAMSQQKNQQQQVAAQEIQQHLDTVGQIKVLSQDRDRIKAKNDALQEEIQNGIRNSHGNLQKYLETGGKTALQAYRNNLLESDEVQQGLKNSLMHNMATDAQMKGQTLRPTAWQQGDKQVQGSYADNYAAFQKGDTHELNFAGGYEEPTGDPAKEFGERFGNAEGKPQVAGAKDVYDYWKNTPKGKGMTEQDHEIVARQKAQAYAAQHGMNGEQGGYPFKSHTPEQLDYARRNAVKEIQADARLRISADKAKEKNQYGSDPMMAIISGAVGLPETINPNVGAYSSIFGQKPDAGVAADATVPKKIVSTEPSEQAKKALATYVGVKYDKNAIAKGQGGYVGKLSHEDKILDPHTLQEAPGHLNDHKFVIKDFISTKMIPSPDNKTSKYYAEVKVHFPNQSTMGDLGIINHHYLAPSSETGAFQKSVDWGSNDATVLIPITNPSEFPLGHLQFNTEMKKYGALQNQSEYDPFYQDATISPEQSDEINQ